MVTTKILSQMEGTIIKVRPQIKEIREKYGEMSYFKYVKQKNRLNSHKAFRLRKEQITSVTRKESARLLGSKVADEVEEQFKGNDSISTAEHTAPIGTPHTLSAGLSASIPMFGNPDPRFKNVIVFSCSGVSFNNALSFSRGFQFHAFRNNQIIDNQLAFFGRTVDPKTILFYPPYSYDTINEMRKNLKSLESESKMGQEQVEKIQKLLEETYSSPHALSGADYIDQLAITNYYFWKKLFPAYSVGEIPNFIMLSQEKILINLLLTYHIDEDTPIHRFIFDEKYQDLILKYFDGITGAFDTKENSGTFLFWAVDKDNTRVQLFKKGKMLVSPDNQFSIELNPESIRQALINKELFPGLLLTFISLSFYYGLSLGGGASQPTYLTQMKNGYIDMMNEVGDIDSATDAEASITDDFVFYRPHLAFIEANSERVSATGMDMYLYNKSGWKEVVKATQTITVNEFITILLPILYKQFCPDDQKEDSLMNISRQEVERFTGFDKKLPPLFSVK